MRHFKTFLALACLLMVLGACWNKKEPKGGKLPELNVEKIKNTEGDSTIYGVCVDATSNTVAILTNNGDTVQYVCADAFNDDGDMVDNVVKGGKFIGDKLAIIGQIGEEENLANLIVNITSLMGRWTSLDRDFEILDGGEVKSSIEAEANPYTAWHIFNGKLVLSKDTFDICELGPDSLLLENDKGIFGYKRKLAE